MDTISFFASLFLSIFLLHLCLHYGVGAADPAFSSNREALEIVRGPGGINHPQNKDCPPPPPPPKPQCPPPPPPPPPPKPKCSPPPPPPPPPPPKPKCSPPPPPPPPPKPQCPPPPPPPPPPKPKCSPPPPPPPPPKPKCPPPPPPTSPRVIKVFHTVQAFKKKIFHDPLHKTKTWDPKQKDVCKYEGFYCDKFPADGKQAVAGVDFNGFHFAGKEGEGLPLSGFIENLTDITVFHANSNNFTGSIPKEISTLQYFYELDLSNNKLDGQFPMEVLRATNLTFLDLRFNSLYGTVPPQVFLLDVDVIFINNNNFVQKLPDNLGSTPALYLTFANNNFTGPIPRSIGQANKTLLEVLFLNNKLTGCLPYEIGLLKMATVFDASINCLTGPIPLSFQCLFKIEVLNLARNQLYGSIPDAICKLPNLGVFNLSDNYFTQVGPECRKLIDRKVLDVEKNCIIDLPNQRSKTHCAAFFAKPKYHLCPNEQSLNYIPCMNKYYSAPLGSSYHRPTVPAPSPLSYGALKPHRL